MPGENVDADETDDLDRDDLEAIVSENPEAVAAFVDRLDAVNELLDVVALGEAALTDEMAVELAGTASTLAESADGLATEETVGLAATVGDNGDELREAMETLIELQRSGTLDELAELGQVGSLATAALDDGMVRSLAGTGAALGEVADAAADEEVREGTKTLLEGLGAAQQSEPSRVGAVGLARGLRDPEIQYGLGYVLALSKAIGRSRSPENES
ncbi:DUF1641 domain-containing protein [Halorubrum cibi]|uniref:Uncharacterized conserved protein YjgD, DUF1641 family n=1 Tax=Halorubrum cibi TaxID=413815 RepID=A0A521B1R0_9EURY|nr:DUF1641 domain-containing protein [Halorubrum cibi]SMO40720.1 Uncharacterized conserved protein YjgD, DUF1641 family [Halorubrum cibi]